MARELLQTDSTGKSKFKPRKCNKSYLAKFPVKTSFCHWKWTLPLCQLSQNAVRWDYEAQKTETAYENKSRRLGQDTSKIFSFEEKMEWSNKCEPS